LQKPHLWTAACQELIFEDSTSPLSQYVLEKRILVFCPSRSSFSSTLTVKGRRKILLKDAIFENFLVLVPHHIFLFWDSKTNHNPLLTIPFALENPSQVKLIFSERGKHPLFCCCCIANTPLRTCMMSISPILITMSV
jgi:hypothetical protein